MQSLKYYLAFYRKTLSTFVQIATVPVISQTNLILFFLLLTLLSIGLPRWLSGKESTYG